MIKNKPDRTVDRIVIVLLLLFGCVCVGAYASEVEYTLNIFGNANEDMNLDEDDVVLVQRIIAGEVPKTRLADANNDGILDESDVDQIRAIIKGTATEIVVLDAYGEAVAVKTPVERLVTLDRMIAENAQAIGVADKVVGIDEETVTRAVILPKISQATNVGSASEPDLEAIVALKPGLVAGIQWFDEDLMAKMRAAGLTPLAMIYHGDMQNSLGYTKVLGYLTGSSKTANEYVSWMGGTFGSIHDRLANLPEDQKTKAIYLYPRSSGGLGSGGNNCPTIKTLQYIGVNTMTKDTKDVGGAIMDSASYFEIDPEIVIAKNPDALVVEDFDEALGYGFTDRKAAQAVIDRIKKRPGFDHINAVKNDRVYLLDVNLVSHSNSLGALYMAKALYPDELADIDPYAIHQEYITRFMKLPDMDVRTAGIFIYPDLES